MNETIYPSPPLSLSLSQINYITSYLYISLTCIIFLSLFIYSSVTVLKSSSLLFRPSMTSEMSEASSNDVFQCLTPLTDSWGPPYDKYHITQLTLAIQAINYPISVSNTAFVLFTRAMPDMNLGAHQSRNTITNKNIESFVCVKVFWNIILGHAKFV